MSPLVHSSILKWISIAKGDYVHMAYTVVAADFSGKNKF